MANTIVVDIVADTRKLVAGVNTTNQKLSTLNGTATSISKGFGLITKALAAIQGAKIAWSWIKDLETENQNFERIAETFGKSADGIIAKIGELSAKFKIDDGDIAASLNELANSTTFRYKKLLPQITELILLADNLSGGAGENIQQYTTAWAKALKSGKVLDGQDLVRLGITSRLSQSEQEQFGKLKTITEQVQFLYKSLQEELQPDALKFTAAQEVTYEVGKMKEAIAAILAEEVLPAVLKGLQLLKKLLFIEDKDGNLKVRDEVEKLAIALGTLWTVGKLAALTEALLKSEGALGGIARELKGFPSLLKGLSFSEIGTAFAILIDSIWSKLGKFSKGLVIYFTVEIGERVAREIVKKFPDTWQEIGNTIIDSVFMPFKDPVGYITKFFKDWWNRFKEVFIQWGRSTFRIASPSKVAEDLGQDILAGLFVPFSVGNIVQKVKDFFINLVGRFRTEVNQVNFRDIGTNIINALVSGMQAIASTPINFIRNLATNMISTFKSFFRISSPSKVFAGFGQNMMQGLALGISGNTRLPQMALNGLTLTPALSGGMGRSITVNINAGIGTDPYEVGRYVQAALDKYAGVNGR